MGFARRSTQPDPDPVTTQEWRDSIQAVAQQWGEGEARRLLHATVESAKDAGVDIEVVETPYLNTIHPDDQGAYPGDLAMEDRLHGIIRWNAMMMVTRANKYFEGIGGHISTYASASHAWEMGFNHFFGAKTAKVLATICTGRATPHPASTPVRGWKGASPTNTLKNSVKKSAERAFPVILILV